MLACFLAGCGSSGSISGPDASAEVGEPDADAAPSSDADSDRDEAGRGDVSQGEAAQDEAGQDAAVEPAPVGVQIGIPGGDDGLGFVPLASQGELRLESFGQGGIHVLLAIRCIGFGNRAFVGVTVTNLSTGVQVVSPPPVRSQLLLCRDENTCDLVPLLAVVSGIVAPGAERNGVHVQVTADVHNDAGLSASGSVEAVLSTADL